MGPFEYNNSAAAVPPVISLFINLIRICVAQFGFVFNMVIKGIPLKDVREKEEDVFSIIHNKIKLNMCIIKALNISQHI